MSGRRTPHSGVPGGDLHEPELSAALGRSVAGVAPRPDAEALLVRVERRAARQRSWLIAAIVVMLVVGGIGGYLVGRGDDAGPARTAVAARGDGTPPVTAPESALVEPVDPVAARAAILQAFADAFDGGSSAAAKDAAVQDGAELRQLRTDVSAYAKRFGYTAEQLAGTTIRVLEVDFIDEAHAAVRFTLTVPERGDVIVDKVGYAVLDGGRWRVALRTACDLLSLDGVIGRCPP
jgi:hypothetical protein